MQLVMIRVGKPIPNKLLFRVKDPGLHITSFSTRFGGWVILDYHSRVYEGEKDSVRIMLTASVRTQNQYEDVRLRQRLVRESGINLYFSGRPNHYHFYLDVRFDFQDDAHTRAQVDAAVRKMNVAVVLVYEAKEAGKFPGAEKGKPPQMQLVGAFSEPLIEPPRGDA